MLHDGGLDDVVCDRLGLVTGPPKLDTWRAMVDKALSATETVTDRDRRQVRRPARRLPLRRRGPASRRCRTRSGARPGLGPERRADGPAWRTPTWRTWTASSSPAASGTGASRARSRRSGTHGRIGVPLLGLCLGLQCSVIEFGRNVLGLTDANSTEFDPSTPHPVIDLMASQEDVEEKGGTMRLGLYAAKLSEGSKIRELYGQELVYERHRHRWEVNNRYRKDLEKRGDETVRSVARRQPRRVHRAGRPSVLRGHPGPPRVPFPSRHALTLCSWGWSGRGGMAVRSGGRAPSRWT